jgi:hypothetical protein
MQGSVGVDQSFDGQNLAVAHGAGEHSAGIAGNIVDQDAASTALSAIASQLGASKAQLVTQRGRQTSLPS